MAEEAQELVVEHAGQPLACDIEFALSDEIAEELTASVPTNVTVEIDPAAE